MTAPYGAARCRYLLFVLDTADPRGIPRVLHPPDKGAGIRWARAFRTLLRSRAMNELEITGRARTHVVELEQTHCALHYEAVASFLAMTDAARSAGIELQARSGYRDFNTQLTIWNRKWRGERPLLDRQSRPLERAAIADADMVDVILTWSSIPGGSRHHWGSDVDVVDAAAIPADYKVQLTSAEYAREGVFAKLNAWLDANLSRFGFFRPYRTDRGGVCPEPWHISYAPVAEAALESLSLSVLRRVLSESNVEGKQHLLDRLPEIYTRYLLNIDPA
jgi:LAS superfamily LD-carboxypeptidase LdcB